MRFIKGLHRDNHPSSQPESTYRDLRNGVLDEERGAVRNEKGASQAASIGSEIKGFVNISGEEIVFFTSSDIILFNSNTDSTTTILSDANLDIRRPIDGEWRILNNGDRVVYWTDNVNPPRRINIDNVQSYNSISEFNLIPGTKSIPEFNLDRVNNFGGNLEYGSYQVAVAYKKEDTATTNFFYVTNPINITRTINDPNTSGSREIGGPEGKLSNKSITFSLDDLDQSYDELVVAVIKDDSVRLLPDIQINDSSVTYTITGNESYIDGSLEEIVINNASYSKAKTMAQLGGVLYLGNVTKTQQINYQKYANNISVEAVAEEASSIPGTNSGRFDNAEDTFKIRSFRRDEVYAFYISFLLRDGSETPAFHIPGRLSKTIEENAYSRLELESYSLPDEGFARAKEDQSGDLSIDASDTSEPQARWTYQDSDSDGDMHSQNYDWGIIDDTGSVVIKKNYVFNGGTLVETALDDFVNEINNQISSDGSVDDAWQATRNNYTVELSYEDGGTEKNNYQFYLEPDPSGGDSSNDDSSIGYWIGQKKDGTQDGDTSDGSAANWDAEITGGSDTAYESIDYEFGNNAGMQVVCDIDSNTGVTNPDYTPSYPEEGDGSTKVARKIVYMLNNDRRSAFTTFQADYTAYLGDEHYNTVPSDVDITLDGASDSIYIIANNKGSDYNGTSANGDGILLSDSGSLTSFGGGTIDELRKGYLKSEGMSLLYDLAAGTTVSGRSDDKTSVSVSQGESTDSIISNLETNIDNNSNYTDISAIEDNSIVRVEDTSGSTDFTGESPGLEVDQFSPQPGVDHSTSSVTFTVLDDWTSPVSYDETDDSDETYLPSYAKKFHVNSRPDIENNTSYWHNRNEKYPDGEDWEVWKVQSDGTGVQKPTDGSEGEYDLTGKNVRHHKFPSRFYERAVAITKSEKYDDETSGNGITDSPVIYETDIDNLYTLGIKVKNIQIPEKWRDRILGYRIHYARKTESNQLSSGQSKAIPVKDDASDRNKDYWGVDSPSGQKHHIFSEFDISNPDNILIPQGYESDTKWNTNGSETEDNKAYLYPFGQIKDRDNLNSVKFLKNYRNLDSSVPGKGIHQVEAIGYIDENQQDISLTSQGFDKDMENPMAESKIIVQAPDGAGIRKGLIDLRKYTENVFLSFDQQETVWTGYFKDLSEISEDGNGDRLNENNPHTSDVIYGGDTFICKDYFKATHLFPYFKINWDGDTPSDNGYFFHGAKFDGTDLEQYHEISTIACMLSGTVPTNSNVTASDYSGFTSSTASVSNLEVGNLRGAINAMAEAGVSASDFEGAIPVPIRIIHSHIVEVRYNTYWKSQDRNDEERPYFEGNSVIDHQRPDEEFYPNVVLLEDTNGENEGLTGGRWTMDFYTEVFNSYEYNIEYNKQNNTKPAFPFSKDAVDKYRFPTRVIRSQQQVIGERDSSFRVFREEDTYDLPENRGELQKIAAFNDSLVLHMKDALFRTRGREEISVGDSRAFLGAGNIFEVEPQEITSNESGFAGIESLEHSIVTPTGYFFVEKDTNRVFQLSADGINIISKQGMRQFFLDNLDADTNTTIGWDPHHERVMVKLDNECISYMPSLQRWVSFHDLDPVFLLNTDNRLLYTDDADDVYRYGTGTTRSMDISFVDISENGQNKRISAVMLDTVVIDGSSEDVDNTFDQISIENEYQSMPLKNIVYFATQGSPYGKNKSYYDQDTIADGEVPARKQRGLWKINRFRDESLLPLSSSEQIYGSGDWKYKKRFKDQYHTITLKFTEGGKEIELIRAFVAGPTSKR